MDVVFTGLGVILLAVAFWMYSLGVGMAAANEPIYGVGGYMVSGNSMAVGNGWTLEVFGYIIGLFGATFAGAGIFVLVMARRS